MGRPLPTRYIKNCAAIRAEGVVSSYSTWAISSKSWRQANLKRRAPSHHNDLATQLKYATPEDAPQ